MLRRLSASISRKSYAKHDDADVDSKVVGQQIEGSKPEGFVRQGIVERFDDVHRHAIIHEGFLKVQSRFGKSDGNLMRWQERYFTLQGLVSMHT